MTADHNDEGRLIPPSYFTGWLADGERGISSDAIVARLTGLEIGKGWAGGTHPADPADFRRCQLLLRAHPLAAAAFPAAMRTVSPQWSRLVDVWDEIHATIEHEAPGYLDNPVGQRASNGYRMMRQVIDGINPTRNQQEQR